MQTDITCKNCGNQFKGKFCNQCGEKVYSDHDKTFKHFLGEAFHFLTHFDNKIFKTWWLIITRPGKVSTDIAAGIRKRYYPSVNLFILGVILYLLFPYFQGLNMPMKNHFGELHRVLAISLVKAKMAAKDLKIEQVAHEFDAMSPKVAKILLLIMIPLGGLVLQLLFRKKRRFYFDHITLASELSTFYLYFNFMLVPLGFWLVSLVLWLSGGTGYFDGGDEITLPLYIVVFGTYCIFAFRRFYGEKRWLAILKSVLFLIGHGFIVYILYRIILFCVVMLLI